MPGDLNVATCKTCGEVAVEPMQAGRWFLISLTSTPMPCGSCGKTGGPLVACSNYV